MAQMTPQRALADLGRLLRSHGYRFVTTAPLTHEIVNRRPDNAEARSLTDVFGWSRPFAADLVGSRIIDLLEFAGAVRADGNLLKSAVRFSSLGELLIVHSAFPTVAEDAVFFGPDTYRTCRAMRAELAADRDFRPHVVVDVGAGAGAVGLYAAALLPGRPRIILADINPEALRMCEVNADLNGVTDTVIRESDILANVGEEADLIVSNPPFMVDRSERTYRNGGGDWGVDIALRIIAEAGGKLSTRGKLMLFTGTPVVGGIDIFASSLDGLLHRDSPALSYAEVDPDIYPEELLQEPYAAADRIAAVFLVAGPGSFRT